MYKSIVVHSAFFVNKMERETGLKPATLSLEG